jgi:hypothetical protein
MIILTIIYILYIASVLFSYHMTRREILADKIDPDLFMIVLILLPMVNLAWGIAALIDDSQIRNPNNKFVQKFFKLNKDVR